MDGRLQPQPDRGMIATPCGDTAHDQHPCGFCPMNLEV
jgi:hypothetical protein